MKNDPEPETLVPPDMENFELDEEPRSLRFPVRRLMAMIGISSALIATTILGFNVYAETQNLGEVIPYWVFSALLLTPTACSCYFFFSFFSPRLRSPYE